jgi:hypothetical protein
VANPALPRYFPDANANALLDPWCVSGDTTDTLGQTVDRPVASSTWAAAPATKTVAFSTPYVSTANTPAYVGIALASTTAAVIDAAPARAAAGNFARAPILVGTTTTPTTTPITGIAGALTATLQVAYCWLT